MYMIVQECSIGFWRALGGVSYVPVILTVLLYYTFREGLFLANME